MCCYCCDVWYSSKRCCQVRFSHSPPGLYQSLWWYGDKFEHNRAPLWRSSIKEVHKVSPQSKKSRHAGYVWSAVEGKVSDRLSLLHCVLHHSGWRNGHNQCVKPSLSRRDWWIIIWERELLWETEGREELRWEEIIMQLVCEPLRILGKSLCALWQISHGGSVVMRPGKGLRLQICACIDEWLCLHTPLFIIWHCLYSACSRSINLFVFCVLVEFMASVMLLFVCMYMFGILWKPAEIQTSFGNWCRSSSFPTAVSCVRCCFSW